MNNDQPRVALVYDRVDSFGGAERLLCVLHEIWPSAPLFTSVYDPSTAVWARNWDIRTTFLRKFLFGTIRHEQLGWLMPIAFESINLSEFDIVISVTSEAAKGIVTLPSQLHVCYLLTPTRYLWSHHIEYLRSIPRGLRPLALLVQSRLRQWDYIAAQRPDHIIAVSRLVQRRCEKYYRREAQVLYPPLQLLESSSSLSRSRRHPDETSGMALRRQQSRALRPTTSASDYYPLSTIHYPRNYFLVVSRLVPYKRIDLAIDVCNRLDLPLLVVGSGSQERRLKELSGKTIRFTGYLTDDQLIEYYQGATALVMPQQEDLGIVALEAQACGTPVITLRNSGSAELVLENKTGFLFEEQTSASLELAIIKAKQTHIDEEACRKNAARFSTDQYKESFRRRIEALWNEHRKN